MKTTTSIAANFSANYSKYLSFISRAIIAILILAGVITGGATLLNIFVTALYNTSA